MLRLICLFSLLIAGASALAFADATPASPFGLRFGLGLPQPVSERLNAVLKAQGQTPVDVTTLGSTEWGFHFYFANWLIDVSGSRVNNNFLRTPSGSTRTRLVIDETDFTLGGRYDSPSGFLLTYTLGMGVSKTLLQLYPSSPSNFSQALATSGQVDLVSSWNWGPVANVRLGWKFATISTSASYSMGVGLTVEGFSSDMKWRLNDDVAISGLDTPWLFAWKPVVWVGME